MDSSLAPVLFLGGSSATASADVLAAEGSTAAVAASTARGSSSQEVWHVLLAVSQDLDQGAGHVRVEATEKQNKSLAAGKKNIQKL